MSRLVPGLLFCLSCSPSTEPTTPPTPAPLQEGAGAVAGPSPDTGVAVDAALADRHTGTHSGGARDTAD